MDTQTASNNQKRKNKFFIKLLCFVVTILLMIGIDFIVANIVHKTGTLPASGEIKNGLSAYELAVEQGYTGNLEDWLKSLGGKSAYEIAVENGYTGTEAEWNKAVANVSNQNSASIANAEFSSKGEFIITLSDGTTINVGKVAGSDGKDGANGKNGKDGINGTNGVNGTNGIDGKDGQEGKGISSASVNEAGQLILAFSDGSTVNLDKIVGTNGIDGINGKDGMNGVDGKNGFDGKDGQDGIGILSIVITEDGNLNITLSNGTTLNLGAIKGADGKDGVNGADGINGADGVNGADGIGITETSINDFGELIITYSDGATANLGKVVGENGKDGVDGNNAISRTEINENGELIIIFDNGTSANLGNVVGKDGRDGIDGINGIDGANGIDGKDGLNGTDGRDGQDGIGISNVNINTNGELVLTFSDNQTINLGRIVGKDGKDGTNGINGIDGAKGEKGDKGADGVNGKDGRDGVGIKNVTVSKEGALTVTLDNGTVLNLGNIKGADGKNGADGAPGKDGDDGLSAYEIAKKYGKTNATSEEEWLEEFKEELKGEKGDTGAKGDTGVQGDKGDPGRGIAKTELVNGELIIYYTDGKSDNLGSVSGSDLSDNILEFILLDDDTYGVKAGGAAKNCKMIEIPEMHNEKEVTQILSNGFTSLTSLTSISIPQTITTIGDLAFYDCPALESISFPNSLQKIGRLSFSNCYSITSVTIPQSVKYIGKYAFYQSGILQVTFEVTDNWLCGGTPLEYNYTANTASSGTSRSTRTYSLSNAEDAANALRRPVKIEVGYNQVRHASGSGTVTIFNYSEQNWFESDWTHV
ncbi:MAG: leucine-rich repeat protein [Eubacterium sp.]|nr:leucine-rich repeat protein [Eubacterium sp.]